MTNLHNKQKRYKKKNGWLGRNASIASLKRYCFEIWADLIKELDKHVCFMCGATERLNSHHLITKKWLKTAFDVKNGITLCVGCHEMNVISAGLSPWFLWEKLKRERPEQYQHMISNRELVCNNEQIIPDFHTILNNLIFEFEKINPTMFVRSKYFSFSEEDEAKIVSDYFNNLEEQLPAIAAKYHCSISCVYEIIRRQGIGKNELKKIYRDRQRQAQGLIVYKINDTGKILEKYSSVAEAAEKNNIKSSALFNCLHELAKTCGGSRWIYEHNYDAGKKEQALRTKLKSGPKIDKNPTSKKVDQFTANGEFIKTWLSMREAKDHTGATNISTACQLNKKNNCTYHKSEGFIWKYH